MPHFRRSIAAILGLILPLCLAGTVQAAPHHRPGRVTTATYRVPAQHKSLHRVSTRATHRPAPRALTAGS